MTSRTDGTGTSAAPARAGLVLGTLILVAGVANLNLSVANVALPDIGKSFDASQTMLDLIAVGYSLGLAASVLWFGALGDRYGRKLMIVLGMSLTIPACLLAGFAPSSGVLFAARVLGGLAAGMAYPTTLALITALWSGPAHEVDRAVVGPGGGIALLGPLISGALLEHFSWGSVFLVTLPLVAIALPMAIFFVPSHVNEGPAGRQPRRRPLGGVRRRADRRDQLPARPEREDGRDRAARGRGRGRGPVLRPAAPRRQSAVRPPRRRPPDLLGRRLRRSSSSAR